MDVIGFSASILIGISLGLIGGGGSILTVPVLVYLFAIDPIIATTYSLFIVGISSIFGALSYMRRKLISIPAVLYFGIPSVISIFLTRRMVLPAIPNHILRIGNFVIDKQLLIMVLFSILMVAASYSMIRKDRVGTGSKHHPNHLMLIVQGIGIGFLTGIVGVGGGFLIIPSLIFLGKLKMKQAVGTSLSIIVMNSLAGFVASLGHFKADWPLLLSITGFAIIGIFIGIGLSKRIDGNKLKPAFGWFILITGMYIIIREIIFQ